MKLFLNSCTLQVAQQSCHVLEVIDVLKFLKSLHSYLSASFRYRQVINAGKQSGQDDMWKLTTGTAQCHVKNHTSLTI